MSLDAFSIVFGLAVLYATLGLLSMILAECVSRALGLRGATLWRGVDALLDEPELRVAFHDHGLIATARASSRGPGPGFLCDQTFALAVLACLGADKAGATIRELEDSVRRLQDSRFRDILLAQLFAAEGDATRLREMIAQWYGRAIAGLGAAYAARIRLTALAIAGLLTIAANADSLALAVNLWGDRLIQAELVHRTVGGAGSQVPPFETGRARALAGSLSFLKEISEQIRPFPLGWGQTLAESRTITDPLSFWSGKLLGFAITIVFACFAAFVWFELLARPLNLRGDRIALHSS
jgi:hypothetical protein